MLMKAIVAAVAAAMVAASGFALAQAPAGAAGSKTVVVKTTVEPKTAVKAQVKKAKAKAKVAKTKRAPEVAERSIVITRAERMAEAKARYDATRK